MKECVLYIFVGQRYILNLRRNAQDEGSLSIRKDHILVQTQPVKVISTDFQRLESIRHKKP
jgi:hypothetical protein